jgi:hypothetical protein
LSKSGLLPADARKMLPAETVCRYENKPVKLYENKDNRMENETDRHRYKYQIIRISIPKNSKLLDCQNIGTVRYCNIKIFCRLYNCIKIKMTADRKKQPDTKRYKCRNTQPAFVTGPEKPVLTGYDRSGHTIPI